VTVAQEASAGSELMPGRHRHRVRVEHADRVDILCLDRGDRTNAIDMLFVDELARATRELSPDAGALLIRANGPRFSVGGDLKFLNGLSQGDLELCVNTMTKSFHSSLAALSQLDIPVVLAGRGAVGGGALGFLAVADIALVSPSTKFATVHASNGLSLDGGASWLLARTLGVRRASEMYLDGAVIDAAEAARSGLVTRTVPDDELEDEALRVARRLADQRVPALRETRELLDEASRSTFAQQLDRETAAMARTVAAVARGGGAFQTSCPPPASGR
jgi:enoyl-CoA hydratase/carnithine racemase